LTKINDKRMFHRVTVMMMELLAQRAAVRLRQTCTKALHDAAAESGSMFEARFLRLLARDRVRHQQQQRRQIVAALTRKRNEAAGGCIGAAGAGGGGGNE
jgi:hypothetical protein